jgi:hypothetical protein
MDNKDNPPICRECLFFVSYNMNPYPHRCKKMKEIVSGADTPCHQVRGNQSLCGIEGRWFKKKEKTQTISFWKKIFKGKRLK